MSSDSKTENPSITSSISVPQEYKLSIEFSENVGYFTMRHFDKDIQISYVDIEVFAHDGYIEPFGCHYSDLSTFAKQMLSPREYKTICTKDIKNIKLDWYNMMSGDDWYANWLYIDLSIDPSINNGEINWRLYDTALSKDSNPMEILHLTLSYDQLKQFSEEITKFAGRVSNMYNLIISGEMTENNVDPALKILPKKYDLSDDDLLFTNQSTKEKKSTLVVRDDSDSEDF